MVFDEQRAQLGEVLCVYASVQRFLHSSAVAHGRPFTVAITGRSRGDMNSELSHSQSSRVAIGDVCALGATVRVVRCGR